MAALASASTRSLPGTPECPLTHFHSMSWRAAAASSCSQRSWFLTGLRSAVRQPRAFQFGTHSVMPRTTYSESVCTRADTPRFSWYLHWELPEPRLEWVRSAGQWRNLVRSYLACSRFVDAQIGRLLAGLEASGRARDTIVVVWGDHGWHLGEKGITGKNTLWEDATRVPLVFAGPGIAAGGRVTSPAELLDVYPTLLEACGLPPRDDLEGTSLVPQLHDAAAPRARPAITTHNAGNHAVRTEHFRYVRYADSSEELYDHRTDPHEWTNLAADPAHAATCAELRRWLPAHDRPPAPGSADRILVYDAASDSAVWENRLSIGRDTPVP